MKRSIYKRISFYLIVMLALPSSAICSMGGVWEREMVSFLATTSESKRLISKATASNGALSGAVSGRGEILDLDTLDLAQEVPPTLSVVVPSDLSFNIDLFEAKEKGQIYSKDFYFQNFSEVDVRVRIDKIYCEFSPASQYQALSSPKDMGEDSNLKQIYLFYEQQNGEAEVLAIDKETGIVATPADAAPLQESLEKGGSANEEDAQKVAVKPGIVITDKPKDEVYTFVLAADTQADTNKVGFRLSGKVNERSAYKWSSNEVKIIAAISIESVIEKIPVEEEIPDEEVLDKEDNQSIPSESTGASGGNGAGGGVKPPESGDSGTTGGAGGEAGTPESGSGGNTGESGSGGETGTPESGSGGSTGESGSGGEAGTPESGSGESSGENGSGEETGAPPESGSWENTGESGAGGEAGTPESGSGESSGENGSGEETGAPPESGSGENTEESGARGEAGTPESGSGGSTGESGSGGETETPESGSGENTGESGSGGEAGTPESGSGESTGESGSEGNSVS